MTLNALSTVFTHVNTRFAAELCNITYRFVHEIQAQQKTVPHIPSPPANLKLSHNSAKFDVSQARLVRKNDCSGRVRA